MKWYLTPNQVEFSTWLRAAIAKHLPNVSVPANAPSKAVSFGEAKLLPLTDTPPTLNEGQIVANR